MNNEFEITKQHLSGDEEHVSFTIRFGQDLHQAVISRTALTVLDGVGGRHIFWVFEENHDTIASAAYQKLKITQSTGILLLGSDDF